MTDARLPGTEDMRCAIGVYEGVRTVTHYGRTQTVHGVFGLLDPEGLFGEPTICLNPPRFWCKYKGGNYGWLACDLPEHQKDAETVLYLTDEIVAFLVWQQNPAKPLPPFLRQVKMADPLKVARGAPRLRSPEELVLAAAAVVAKGIAAVAKDISEQKRIPRNKGNKARKRAEKLSKE